MLTQRERGPHFRIRLSGPKEGETNALDVATFLIDFVTLYEVLRMEAEPGEQQYKLTRFTLYRNAHRVSPRDRLLLQRLSYESPLTLQAIFAAVGGAEAAAWPLLAQEEPGDAATIKPAVTPTGFEPMYRP